MAKYGIFEGRKNFDIKPTFTGKVSSVVDGDVLSFIDTSFPFDINAKNASGETLYLISGVSAKVHFNSGNLAGYEFEVHAYDHATHKFTLVKQTDDRGNVFPSETSPAFQISKTTHTRCLTSLIRATSKKKQKRSWRKRATSIMTKIHNQRFNIR